MSKTLILSVGGSPEPLIESLVHHRPDEVVFFASKETVENIGQLKSTLQQHGVSFSNTNVIVDDAESLSLCYQKALEAIESVAANDAEAASTVIDYTGGTKSMVAGLMLASVGRGCDYAYVGGRQRTREGTGVVISGAENLRSMEDPWAVYAVDEKKRLCLFIERYQFAAALEVVESLSARAGAREQQLFKHLRAIIQGYIAWERFDHKGANAPLRKGLFGLKDYLALVPAPRLADYVQGVEDNIKFLEQIKQETRNFKKDRLCSALVGDLLSNARRRAEEGKFDDAMARLYRALEMIGQIAFNDRFGCPTNNVQKECLPEAIKNEYVNRYESSDDGRIRLPLEPTFIALAEADDDVGLKYRACEKALIKILRSRNDSILAHGMIPVKEATYQELLEQISQFAGDLPMVRFPRLDLS